MEVGVYPEKEDISAKRFIFPSVAHERRRAALAALCVFAVALAAALFPAGGFGTYPSGVGTGGGPDAPDDGAVPDPTTDGRPTSDGSATTTESGPTEESSGTTTPGTTSDTTTPPGGDGSDGDSGDSTLAAALVALFGLLGAALFGGFRTGVLAVEGSAGGSLPVTITVRGTPVGSLVGAIPSRTMTLVVGLSSSVPQLLDDAATLAREVGGGLATVAGGLARGIAGTLRIGAEGLGATLAAVPRALAGLGAGASVLSGVGRSLSLPSFGGRDSSRGRTGAKAGSDTEQADAGPPTIEEAWQTMADRVSINRRTRTPAEIARAAIERGYPSDAVQRLTDSFREVRYGGFPRSERTEAARTALDRLRRHWRDDE
jgi:hypothetical protein